MTLDPRPIARPEISPARIRITDIGSKEFDIAPRGFLAEIGDKRRHDIGRAVIGDDLGSRLRRVPQRRTPKRGPVPPVPRAKKGSISML